MSDDARRAGERAKAEHELRLAIAAEARRERLLRGKIKTWFYFGVAIFVVLFLAAMLLT